MHGRNAVEGAALRPEIAAPVRLGYSASVACAVLHEVFNVTVFAWGSAGGTELRSLVEFPVSAFGFRHSSFLWTAPCRLHLRLHLRRQG